MKISLIINWIELKQFPGRTVKLNVLTFAKELQYFHTYNFYIIFTLIGVWASIKGSLHIWRSMEFICAKHVSICVVWFPTNEFVIRIDWYKYNWQANDCKWMKKRKIESQICRQILLYLFYRVRSTLWNRNDLISNWIVYNTYYINYYVAAIFGVIFLDLFYYLFTINKKTKYCALCLLRNSNMIKLQRVSMRLIETKGKKWNKTSVWSSLIWINWEREKNVQHFRNHQRQFTHEIYNLPGK